VGLDDGAAQRGQLAELRADGLSRDGLPSSRRQEGNSMALVLLGDTRCVVCDLPIDDSGDLVSFPPFVLSNIDPLSPFSDAAIHHHCVSTSLRAADAVRWSNAFLESNRPNNRVCAACGEVIRDWRDHLGFGFLTADESDPLNEFNFTHLHQSHVHEWTSSKDVVGNSYGTGVSLIESSQGQQWTP
jgi:hypothetical protein